MDPIEVRVGGSAWRIHWIPAARYADVQRLAEPGEGKRRVYLVVASADSLPGLVVAIKDAGFRAVYPDAVDPLCKAIQERMSKGAVHAEVP